MDPVTGIGLAGSAIQIAEFSAKVFSALFAYFQGVANAPENSEAVQQELLAVTLVLKTLAPEFDDQFLRTEDLTSFMQLLTEIHRRIELPKGLSVKRLKWPFSQKENLKYLSRLERFKATFTLALATKQSGVLQELADSSKAFSQQIFNENRKKVLRWLSPGPADQKHQVLQKTRAKNSGQWFLCHPHFQSWIEAPPSALLFCPGIPGSGKSYMMSLVIDHLRGNLARERTAVIFVYFNYKDQDNQTVENVLASLLKQLLTSLDFLPPAVQEVYDEYHTSSLSPNAETLLSAITSVAPEFETIYVVLDALDEFKQMHMGALVSAVMQLRTLNLSFLCTSRTHLTDLSDQLGHGAHWVLEIFADSIDVSNYLTERLNQEWLYDEDDKNLIRQKIGAQANGKFLLARYQLDAVLAMAEPREALESLDRLPTTLTEAYTEILRRIEQDQASRVVLKALSWMYHARRALHVEELLDVLSVRINDKELFRKYRSRKDVLIRQCQSLVREDPSTGTVEFTHNTVQEFLQKHCSAILLGNEDIAGICLTYLTFDVFEEGPCYKKELEESVNAHRFLYYAVEFWGFHTRGKGEENVDVQNALVRLFNSSKIRNALWQLHWMARSGRWGNYGTTITCPEIGEWTPLHIIAQHGLSKVHDLVLQSNNKSSPFYQLLLGDINAKDPEGLTALHMAVSKNDMKMVIRLIQAGADIKARNNMQYTVLHLAADNGHEHMVIKLLESGADLEARTQGGSTALACAAYHGHTNVVTALLRAGADVNARQYGGRTPIIRAASQQHKETVLALLAGGAEVSLPSSSADELTRLIESTEDFGEVLRVLAFHNPEDHEYRKVLGNWYTGQGLFSDALREYEHGLRLDNVNLGLPTELIRHFGVSCDDCLDYIIGRRFRCTVCKDFDLCQTCFEKPRRVRHFTADNHLFLSIPGEGWNNLSGHIEP